MVVDYVSKWVEAMPCKKADSRHSKRMFEEVIFSRFGTPRMVIVMEEHISLIKSFTHTYKLMEYDIM